MFIYVCEEAEQEMTCGIFVEYFIDIVEYI